MDAEVEVEVDVKLESVGEMVVEEVSVGDIVLGSVRAWLESSNRKDGREGRTRDGFVASSWSLKSGSERAESQAPRVGLEHRFSAAFVKLDRSSPIVENLANSTKADS